MRSRAFIGSRPAYLQCIQPCRQLPSQVDLGRLWPRLINITAGRSESVQNYMAEARQARQDAWSVGAAQFSSSANRQG